MKDIKIYNKDYYEKNKEKLIENSKIYYEKNKEKINEKERIKHLENVEGVKEYLKIKSDYDKDYYEKNKEKIKLRKHKYRYDNYLKSLLIDVKSGSKKRNIEFNLQLEDLPEIPVKCPVLNIPLDFSSKDNSPSIDRTDNNKGYIKGNIDIISYRANRIKNNSNLSEIRLLLEYLENKLNG